MLRKLRNDRIRTCVPLSLVLFFLLTHIVLADTGDTVPSCDSATNLEPNATWRDFASAGQNRLVRLDLPSSGIATVDLLSEPGRQSGWIDLRPDACDATSPRGDRGGEMMPGVLLVEQSATHVVLATPTAGTLFFHVAVGGPRPSLVTSFSAATVVDETFHLAGSGLEVRQTSYLTSGFSLKVDPEDIDPDPDALTSPLGDRERVTGGGRLLASFLTLQAAEQGKETLSLKVDPEDIDPDPDALTVDGTGPVLRRLLHYEPTCRQSEIDDHGDTTSCATPLGLGQYTVGEISNAWGDDGDVFVLHLAEVTTLEITLTADSFAGSVRGELLDRFGQRLAVDGGGADDGGGFRIVSTLAPGRYFFRVAGDGSYEIRATARDW